MGNFSREKTTKIHEKLLKFSLLLVAFYFFAVALAHFIGFKIPMLFIYYDVPSNIYQDRIISFLAMGWGVFFLAAGNKPLENKTLVGASIVAGVLAIIGLSMNTWLAEFEKLTSDFSLFVYWLQIGLLACIVLWIFWLYRKIF